jgi:hypothetical protein
LYGSDVYSTFLIKPCNTTWFDDLNLDDVAALFNASSATKNGPQSWSMDSVQVYTSDPVDILGESLGYYGAVFWPASVVTDLQPPYTLLYLRKNQQLIWDAGKPTYWLTDSLLSNYVMMGYKVPKDELDNLGDQFQDLQEGWNYNVVNISEELVFTSISGWGPGKGSEIVQDEFDQIYLWSSDGGPTTTSGGIAKSGSPLCLAAISIALRTCFMM